MPKKIEPFDFWYAVNNTEVVRLPRQPLETFGTTVLQYFMVSELMDTPSQVRIRNGRMQAQQPQIITPESYAQNLLEGFGDEAARYIDWLREHEDDLRILQYGYQLKQESFSENIVSDNINNVVERIIRDKTSATDTGSAVIVGVDDPWDVCLVKLFWEIVQNSAQINIRQLNEKKMFRLAGNSSTVLHAEIEQDFLEASRDSSKIPELGTKLQKHNIFEHYQDRFFALVKNSKR